MIPEALASSHGIVPFDKSETEIKLATINPSDLQTVEFIKRKTGLTPKIHITTPASLEEIFKQYRRSLKAEFEEISPVAAAEKEEPEKLCEMAEDLPIIRIVDNRLPLCYYLLVTLNSCFLILTSIKIWPIKKQEVLQL